MSVVDLPKKPLTPLSAKCSAISITKRKQPAFFFFYHPDKGQSGRAIVPYSTCKRKREERRRKEGGRTVGKDGVFLTSLQPPLLPAHFQSNSGNKLISGHTIASVRW